MTKFALFDDAGLPSAFYAEDIHGLRSIDGELNPACLIPADAVEITDDQWQEFLANPGRRKWAAGEVIAYDPPPSMPTAEDVNQERDRRTATMFVFNSVAYQLDEKSINRITAMGADARFAVLAGATVNDLRWADPNNDFGWIATDNSVTPMDAQTMSAFADAAKLWVSRNTFAGAAIKAMDPLPEDVTADELWPSPE